MHVLQVVEHVNALKTSFLQKFTYIMHCCILNQNMGCLRVHSKNSLACHWLFYWPGMKEHDMMKNTSATKMRARTFPCQNACGVKADGMGPSYWRRFPLRCYTQDSIIMVLLVSYGMYGCKTLVIQLLCVQWALISGITVHVHSVITSYESGSPQSWYQSHPDCRKP